MTFTDGPYVESKEFLGGFTVVDVVDDDAARLWAGKVAEACGWPQEVRRFKPKNSTASDAGAGWLSGRITFQYRRQ